jgi:hypothetical protein
MMERGWYWLVVQLAAVAAGIYAGKWVFDVVST